MPFAAAIFTADSAVPSVSMPSERSRIFADFGFSNCEEAKLIAEAMSVALVSGRFAARY